MNKWNPKDYFFKGRTFEWDKDLTSKQMKALKKGEVFILLGEDGKPLARILMDSYNQIRERNLREPQPEIDIAIKRINT